MQDRMARLPRGGTVIRRARRRAGLTQAQLASLLSTSQSLVARWENGAVEPPFETVVRAARACGFDLSTALFTYDDQHDALIDENLRLEPEARLTAMVDGLNAIEALRTRAVRRGRSHR